jgi:PAS domain S-box-containing protein
VTAAAVPAGAALGHDCAVFIAAPDGTIVSRNAEAARFNGTRAENIFGPVFSHLFAHAEQPGDELAAVARQGGYAGDGWFHGGDGVRFWASIVITAMTDAAGAVTGFCAVVRDLGKNSLGTQQFRLAIEAAPTGMIVTDQTGRIVLVNTHIENLFGYARAELTGQAVELLVPERFRGAHPSFRAGFFSAAHARMMGAGRDLYGLRKDGREVPIEIGLNPIETSEGAFVLSSIVDITERKRSSEQFRLAIEASPTGMIMVDRDGGIVLVNAHVEALFGYAREELIGRPVEMLVPQQLRQRHPGFRHDFSRAPHPRTMGAGRDLRGLHKSGAEIPIEIALNPIDTADGAFVLCSVVNITERMRVQHERETLLMEIHHRIKNNLQVVSSLINIQLNRTDDAASRDSLSGCAARVQAIALIHAMLYQTRDYLHIPFSEYVQRLSGNVLSVAGDAGTGRVALELAVDNVELHVDKAVPCGLILNELITNALKHGFPDDRHGIVRVELRATGLDRLRLTVRDNGVGAPSHLDLLDVRSMGMQLVRELAMQLRSTLEVERDDWTSFTLEFSREA